MAVVAAFDQDYKVTTQSPLSCGITNVLRVVAHKPEWRSR